MMRFSFGLCLFAMLPALAQNAPQCNFQVRVVDSVTQAPIAGVTVVLSQSARPVSGRTGQDGAFVGSTDICGAYLLNVRQKGYRATGEVMGRMVDLKSDAEMIVTVSMLHLAVLTGRVVDQYGDPVRGAIVRTEDRIGGPEGVEFQGAAATTDDLGEYRMAGVEPGKHLVAVEFSSANPGRPGVPSREHWPQLSGLVLYPDATEIELAQPVSAAEGETVRLSDVHLKLRRVVAISGKIKPAPATGSVSLERTLHLALHSSPMVQAGAPDADGSFRIEAPPGSYLLSATDRTTGKLSRPLKIEVGDRDLTGLELALGPGYELRGRFSVDGPEHIDYSQMRVNFGWDSVKVDASGSFQSNAPSDKVTYMMQGLPEGWYVRSVQAAGKQIVGRKFSIEPGLAEMLFTLSARGATVSIRVEPSPGGATPAYVILLPERGLIPDVESIAGATKLSGDGLYVARGLAPGTYRVLTFDASNWALMMSPDVLGKYRDTAPSVTVSEGETRKISVPMTNFKPE